MDGKDPRRDLAVLIEDVPEVATVLADLLERSGGFRVAAIAGGVREGVRSVLEHGPAVALVDHELGDGTSLDVLDGLRRAGWWGPVVVVTGHRSPAVIDAVLGAGAVGCLTKSGSAGLAAAVRSLLATEPVLR